MGRPQAAAGNHMRGGWGGRRGGAEARAWPLSRVEGPLPEASWGRINSENREGGSSGMTGGLDLASHPGTLQLASWSLNALPL